MFLTAPVFKYGNCFRIKAQFAKHYSYICLLGIYYIDTAIIRPYVALLFFYCFWVDTDDIAVLIVLPQILYFVILSMGQAR